MGIKGGGEGVEKINKVQAALPHLLAYMVSSRPPASHPLKRAAGTGSEVVPGVRRAGRMPLVSSHRGAVQVMRPPFLTLPSLSGMQFISSCGPASRDNPI